jgi:hypothetical protein
LRSLHSGFRTQEVDENNLRQPGDPVPEKMGFRPVALRRRLWTALPFRVPYKMRNNRLRFLLNEIAQ